MITIYGLQSPYVYRVRACLLQKGLGFQHVSVNLANRSEEFRKLSPIGTIPVLEDEDGTAVCDSFHIGLYLDEKYPNTHKMFGHSLKEKVKVFNAMGVIDRIHTVLGPFNAEKYGYAERFRKTNLTHRALLYDVQQKEDALADLSRRLEALEGLRQGMHFTSLFSFADASMVVVLRSMENLGINIGSWKEWSGNLLGDPKIAQMFTPQDEKGVREI